MSVTSGSVRVSRVLDYLTEPGLLSWFRKNSPAKTKKISDEAMRIGSEVDVLVQEDINTHKYIVPIDVSISNCMRGWELFKTEYPDFVPSVKEMQVELEYDGVIGHPDFILERDSGWGIVDLKCASAIRPRHWTQTAKYEHLLMMTKYLNSPGFIGILRLDKVTGLYEYKEINDRAYILYEIRVFDAYLTAYHHNFNNREIIRRQLEEEIL